MGGDTCLYIIRTEDVEQQDKVSTKQERTQENTSFDKKVEISLPGPVCHVGVSCDGLTVSVVVRLGQFLSCLLYDLRGLLSSPPDKPLSCTELNTTSSSVQMSGLVWNPALPDMFCISWRDGSLALYTVTPAGQTDCLTLPPATGVRAMDWSPRGKQLVVIKENCELVQYKPDLSVPKYPKLQEMKKLPGPSKAGSSGVSVCWLSTHEFLVGVSQDGGETLGCWLVTGSKAGPVTHVDYDDPCYSTGGKGGSFQCHNISDWGVVAVASSTSIELGVLGLNSPPPGYTQWILEDNARAEIPLNKNEECYPVGLAMDLTAAEPTPVGESLGPASPLLYLLSSSGLLCPYYCVNTRPGAGPLSCPRETPPGGQRPGSVILPASAPVQPAITQPPPPVVPVKPLPVPALAQPPPAAKPFNFSSPATSTPVPDKVNPVKFSFLSESKPAAPAASKAEEKQAPPGQAVSKTLFVSEQSSTFPLSKSSSSSSQDSNPVSEVTNSKINAAIDEEFEAFEAELAKLRKSMASLKCEVGSEEDKVTICSGVEQCNKFCRDIIETTKCQSSEIFALRPSILETFSWLEEAVARDKSEVEHKYQQLVRARPLDPRSQRMMDNLRSQLFYCEQQVEEVGTVLDSQWDQHVTKLKRNLRGERSTVLEELSAAVVNNHKILDRQGDRVEELQLEVRRLQARYPLTMGGAGKSPVKSKAETELDNLAASMREKSKLSPSAKSSGLAEKTVSTPKNSHRSKPDHTVKSPVAALSPGLDTSIRAALDNRPLTVIKPLPRESPSKPSSASLLEKLKQTASVPLITPEKTKPKQVVYEPISPASPSLPAYGSSSTGIPSQPPAFPLSSKAGVASVAPSAPAASKAVPAASVIASKASQGFSFGSPAAPAPSLATTGTGSILSSLSKPAQQTSFAFSGFAPTSTSSSTAPALPSFGSTATPAASTLSSFSATIPKTNSSSISILGSASPSLGVSKVSAFSPSLPSSTAQSTPAKEEKVRSEAAAPTSASSAFAGDKKVTGGVLGSSSTQPALSGVTSQKTSTTPVKVEGGIPAPKTTTSVTGSNVLGFGGANVTVSSTSESTALLSGGSSLTSKPSATTTSTVSSVFGGISTTASSSSVFGGAKSVPAVSSGASPFAAPSASTKSIFGSNTVTTAATSFTPSLPTTSSGSSVFGAPGGVFGSAAAGGSETLSGKGDESKAQGIFGGSQPTSSSSSGIFGGSTSASTTSSQPQKSIFGSSSASPAIFGGSGSGTTTSSVFGSQTAASKSGESKEATPTRGIFGGSTQPTSTSSGIFGGAPTTSSATSGIFGGGSKPTSTNNAGVFGGTQPTSTSTNTGGIFGGAKTTSSSSAGIFGGGSSQPTSSAPAGVFGGSQTTNTTTSSGGIFGGAKPTSSSSVGIFGGGSQPNASSSGGIFGGSQPTSSTTSAGVFGGTSQPTSSSSVFGGGSQTSSSGIFGGSQPTAPSSGIFGGGTQSQPKQPSSVFKPAESSSVFGAQSTSQPQSSGGLFGQQATSSSAGKYRLSELLQLVTLFSQDCLVRQVEAEASWEV